MADDQRDNDTHVQETIGGSHDSSTILVAGARSSVATTLLRPSVTPNTDTPRPDPYGHDLSDGRTVTRRHARPLGRHGEPVSSATENSVDPEPATVMGSDDGDSEIWKRFRRRPCAEYQCSNARRGQCLSTLSIKAEALEAQPSVTQAKSAVVTAPSSAKLPLVPVTKEPALTRERVPSDSLNGGGDLESEEGEKYEDPLSKSSGRYWG